MQALSALQEDGSALIVEHVVVVRGEDRSIDLAVLPGVPCSHYERGLDAIDITPAALCQGPPPAGVSFRVQDIVGTGAR